MNPCCCTSMESTIAASSLSITRKPALCMPKNREEEKEEEEDKVENKKQRRRNERKKERDEWKKARLQEETDKDKQTRRNQTRHEWSGCHQNVLFLSQLSKNHSAFLVLSSSLLLFLRSLTGTTACMHARTSSLLDFSQRSTWKQEGESS